MRFEHTLTIDRPPEAVFSVLTDPDRLHEWQPIKVEVRRTATGPLSRGERVEEANKVMGRTTWSTFEVTEYDPGRLFAMKAIDGPLLLDGRWEFGADDGGTRLHVAGSGPPPRLRFLDGVISRVLDKRFRGYHAALKRLVESGP